MVRYGKMLRKLSLQFWNLDSCLGKHISPSLHAEYVQEVISLSTHMYDQMGVFHSRKRRGTFQAYDLAAGFPRA